MSEKNGNLTKPQRLALEALAKGGTKDQAAAVADRTRRTLDRWMVEDPVFQEAVRKSTDAAILDGGRRLAGLLNTAIQAIGHVLTGKETSDGARLRAADMVISNLIKLREFHELEERVTALEERLKNG